MVQADEVNGITHVDVNAVFKVETRGSGIVDRVRFREIVDSAESKQFYGDTNTQSRN